MIIQDKVETSDILEHIGYLIKTASMSQVFAWKSLLNFDLEYRKAQAMNSFPLGADSPFLMQLLLKPAMDQQRKANWTSNGQRKFPNVTDPSSGKTVCGRYNGRNGCYMSNCRYAHVCSACFSESHGNFNHKPSEARQGSSTQAATQQQVSKNCRNLLA